PTLAIGGKGVISVTANIAPRLNSEMIKAWESVDIEKAKALHYRLLPLARACFNESNPIPVKAGVSLLGKCNNKVRSPLTEASQATIDKMKSAIESLNSR
ncbi:TPA: 4-hydroxy-tetrahydrodipicolinate synthase, partial [bacterium]|nr:4-hydroxy-tetrahydrodipicolinate synthase [bacterium]